MGNGSNAAVHGIGTVDLKFTSAKIVLLKNMQHAPSIKKNLVSGSLLCRDGSKLVFESNKVVISRYGQFIGKVLSVKTHRRVATGNTKSREAAGALAGTGPSVNGLDPGTRRRFRRCRACHLTYTRSGRCKCAFDGLPACTNTCKH